jgi:hypothetical protein
MSTAQPKTLVKQCLQCKLRINWDITTSYASRLRTGAGTGVPHSCLQVWARCAYICWHRRVCKVRSSSHVGHTHRIGVPGVVWRRCPAHIIRAIAGMRFVQDHQSDIIAVNVTVTVLLPCALRHLAIQVTVQDLAKAQHVLLMPGYSARKEVPLCDRSATYPCFLYCCLCFVSCMRMYSFLCSQWTALTIRSLQCELLRQRLSLPKCHECFVESDDTKDRRRALVASGHACPLICKAVQHLSRFSMATSPRRTDDGDTDPVKENWLSKS